MRIVILRDPKESAKKCSLTPLRGKPGIEFIPFDPKLVYDLGPATLLDPAGTPLSPADASLPLVVLDSSWRNLPKLRRSLRGEIFPRSIPKGFVTAYPRKSKSFADPSNGLASVEALFAAAAVLGQSRKDFLTEYRWAGSFLEANRHLLDGLV